MSRKKLAAIAIAIILIIPSTFLGILFYQMTSLKVSVDFDETQVVSWILAILRGSMPDVSVRLVFTNPTFLTVDVTDVYAQLYIEDQYALETTIGSLFIPAGKTVYKDLTFSIAEASRVYGLISQASGNYGGELKLTLMGHATAHLFLLSLRLPFSVERYYMTKELRLRFDFHEWIDANGQVISTATVGAQVYVKVKVTNPTRKQTIISTVGVRVMMDNPFWMPDEEMKYSTQSVTLSPTSSTTISLSFIPPKRGIYYFDIFIDGNCVYTQPPIIPPRLQVS